MLTPQAFNALLRTLEEPPTHGKFIFATTDVHRVPATIISRCQRFDFNRISLQVISDRLEYILKEEGFEYDPESINAIARKADGSMRDGLSLLDQSISYCGEKIHYDGVVKALGLITDELYFKFTRSIREKNAEEMIKLLASFSGFGVPAAEVLVGIGEHIRNIMYGGIQNGDSLLEISNCCNGYPMNPVRPGREQQLVVIFMCRQNPEMELAGFLRISNRMVKRRCTAE